MINLNIDITNAISSLFPGAKWAFHGEVTYENLTWLDTEIAKPSKATLDAEVIRLQSVYDAKEYARKREFEYPPVTDYLDGVVKGNQAQIDAYIAACQAVKTKYPKPE
jgi:hypothetical protein